MRDTGRGSDRREVSRRRFVAATGTSAIVAAIAGCPGSDVDGGVGNGTTGATETGGAVTDTTSARDGPTTVTWQFEAAAAREHGEEIAATLADRLSDDVAVDVVPADEDPDQRRADYERVLDAEEPAPDLFLMDHGLVNPFGQRGLLGNVSELLGEDASATVDEEYFDAFAATAREYESGDLYGLPIAPDLPTMQYRVDLVEAAGYSPRENGWATEPTTWEEWSHVTADVLDHADVEYGFTTQWDVYDGTACCTFNEVLTSWGGAYFGGRETLFGPVGDRPITVAEEPVIRSLNMMRQFVHDDSFEGPVEYAGGFTPPEVLQWVERDSWEPFARGNAVMHRNWSDSLWRAGRPPDDADGPALGETLGAMPMPYAVPESEAQADGAGGTTAALGGWHATVNPHSENESAIEAVLRASMEPDFQLELLSLLGWLPPRPALFDDGRARDVPVLGRYLDTLKVAGENAMPHPATPVWNDQASVVAQEANRAVARELPADEAMGDLRQSLEEIERTA